MHENEDPVDATFFSCRFQYLRQRQTQRERRDSVTEVQNNVDPEVLPRSDRPLTSCRFESYNLNAPCIPSHPVVGSVVNPAVRDQQLASCCLTLSGRALNDCTCSHNNRRQQSLSSSSLQIPRHSKLKKLYAVRNKKYWASRGTNRCARRRRFPTLAQRKAANVREQRRMMTLKDAYKSLRECLPISSNEKKMSRIETLRLAIDYIRYLKGLLDDSGSAEEDTYKSEEDERREAYSSTDLNKNL